MKRIFFIAAPWTKYSKNTILIRENAMKCSENKKFYINSQMLEMIITKSFAYLDRNCYKIEGAISNVALIFKLLQTNNLICINDNLTNLFIIKAVKESPADKRAIKIMAIQALNGDLKKKILSSIFDHSFDEGLLLVEDLMKKKIFTTAKGHLVIDKA